MKNPFSSGCRCSLEMAAKVAALSCWLLGLILLRKAHYINVLVAWKKTQRLFFYQKHHKKKWIFQPIFELTLCCVYSEATWCLLAWLVVHHSFPFLRGGRCSAAPSVKHSGFEGNDKLRHWKYSSLSILPGIFLELLQSQCIILMFCIAVCFPSPVYVAAFHA